MKKLLSLTALLFPFISQAHPGHGGSDGGYTIIHYFTEPQHALLTLGAFAVTVIYLARARKKRQS